AIEGLRDGSLVRVLPQYQLQQLNVYALYPSRQYLDAKIKTFVAFLRERLPGILEAEEEELRELSRRNACGSARQAQPA
ncbi:LysR substrate-binding domain-containing protein, partial [Pseudomonas luteola]